MQSVKTLPPTSTTGITAQGATTNIFNIGIKTLNIYNEATTQNKRQVVKPIFKISTNEVHKDGSSQQLQNIGAEAGVKHIPNQRYQATGNSNHNRQGHSRRRKSSILNNPGNKEERKETTNALQTQEQEKAYRTTFATSTANNLLGKNDNHIPGGQQHQYTKSLIEISHDIEMEDDTTTNEKATTTKDSLELPPVVNTGNRVNYNGKGVAQASKVEVVCLQLNRLKGQSFIEQFSCKGSSIPFQQVSQQPNIPREILIRTEEKNYLFNYWLDYFQHLRIEERKSMCDDIFHRHPDTQKYLRAHFVDWLFHVNECLRKDDETIVFLAINLMDRYYCSPLTQYPQPPTDLQLNGVTAYFIISKVFEIEPVDLQTMTQEMCYHKYTDEQFIDRETEIVRSMSCEIDAPHVLEFLLLYFKIIKFYVQELLGDSLTKQMHRYIKCCETIARDFAKLTLTDIILISVKPSIIAACAVEFGLFSCYRSFHQHKDSKNDRQRLHFTESDMKILTHAWHDIAARLLKEAKVQEIEEFMKEIAERLSYINHKCGKKLEHIFTKQISCLLPPYQEKWHEKYSQII